jgi:hypothetical protein
MSSRWSSGDARRVITKVAGRTSPGAGSLRALATELRKRRAEQANNCPTSLRTGLFWRSAPVSGPAGTSMASSASTSWPTPTGREARQ